jgi:hypothetical protein
VLPYVCGRRRWRYGVLVRVETAAGTCTLCSIFRDIAKKCETVMVLFSLSKLNTLLYKSPDMHYAMHKLVKNTLPSHHVKRDDTRVPSSCRRAEKQAVSRHPEWLDLSLKRVLSVEFVELSP